MTGHEAKNGLILPLDAFIRSVEVNRNAPHAFFLGAGASISSNVISADMCIWQWKRLIFITNNPGLQHQLPDLSLLSVQDRIQRWLDSDGNYPPRGSAEEYGFYVERCYPIADDRRRYFQHLCDQAKPHISYELLCLLAEAEIVKSVWTTNFDGLVAKAATAAKITPIEIGLDTAHRIVRLPNRGELLCVALHGDYRYDALKNTPAELQEQDRRLRSALVQQLSDYNLVVVGYSGRDVSVMDTLTQAYAQHGAGRLYWCGYGDADPSPIVEKLLNTAREHGREAFYIQTGGFDDLIQRLSLNCLKGEILDRAKALSETILRSTKPNLTPFAITPSSVTGYIKSNAFQIDCPTELFQFDCEYLNSPGAWQRLRLLISGTDVLAVLSKGKVLALGTPGDIRTAFAGKITSEIVRVPINELDLADDDGMIVHLFRTAIVRSLAELRGFNTDNQYTIWIKDELIGTETRDGRQFQGYKAAALKLRRYTGKQYLVIEPTVYITDTDNRPAPEEIRKELRNKWLSKQWNSVFNSDVNFWANRLLPSGNTRFEFPPSSSSGFMFSAASAPGFAAICGARGKPALRSSIVGKIQRYVVWSGTEYPEPPLIFSNIQGDSYVQDIQPLKGLVRNRPYDFQRNDDTLGREIRIGVICPKRDAQKLSSFLAVFQQQIPPEGNLEYMLEYPGFHQAFGVPLNIPQLHNTAWVECPEPDYLLDVKEGAAVLRRDILGCISSLWAATKPHIVIIYIPQRWLQWTSYSFGDETFDLHDFIKADCVQRGIATQVLNQDTIEDYRQRCRITWFLALALYIKAMRTPWILDSTDQETAFIGLGYSQVINAPKGKHIILGCSHLYNAAGLGLSYRLSKIEDPLFDPKDRFQRNPFMSRDDARRTGESTRQLFFQSGMGLPKRVVIHKRTPFRQEEREGLLQGLSGIEIVDMLEVTAEPALRYVSSGVQNGGLAADNFPINRGTAIVLDETRALLWVHGTTAAVDPNRKYYLGKRRIPTPIVVTRHHGTSPLNTLGQEILGLSKMNWNNFDMYSKLPATIDSSNAIARIGLLLERYGTALHDYRLFI